MDIGQIESLINKLYSPIDPKEAKSIQESLQLIQRDPQGWQLASQLLLSNSTNCRFFGAHTFQVKIARDWNTLPEERIDWLRDELLQAIIRQSPGPMFITTRLSLALIAYAFHTIPHRWKQFLSNFVHILQTTGPSYGVSMIHISQTILEFMKLLPEEVTSVDIIGGQRIQIMSALKDSIPTVTSAIGELLSPASGADIALQKKALKCLQSWTQFGLDLKDVRIVLQRALVLLCNNDLFEEASDLLIEAMQQSKWTSHRSFRDEILVCLSSESIQQRYRDCIEEEDTDTARQLARLFTTFGEAFSDYVAKELPNERVRVLVNMNLGLTAFAGCYPAEQEVTEIPLNFWYILQETAYDCGMIPLRDDGSEDSLWKRRCGEVVLTIYRELVVILLQKCAYPEHAVWETWPKDVKDRFRRIGRIDLGDTMLNAYYVLRGEMITMLMDHASVIIHNWNTMPLASQNLEAVMFGLKSIADEIEPEEGEFISQLINPDLLSRLSPNDDHRLKNTALQLIGSLAELLKNNANSLRTALNFIVPLLTVRHLSAAAANAFAAICDHGRESLVENLDTLLQVYLSMIQAGTEASTLSKVIEAISNVIQVIPLLEAIPPLMALTSPLIERLASSLQGAKSNPDEAQKIIITQLQHLTACCKGLQPSNDDNQSMRERYEVYDNFASGKQTIMCMGMNGFPEFSRAIHQTVQQVVSTWCNDKLVAEALSQFVESGIRSTSPFLALPFNDLVSLTESTFERAPFACWLSTGTLTVTIFGGRKENLARLGAMIVTMTRKTLSFICQLEDMETHPDVTNNYFDLLTQTIQRCPVIFFQLSPDMMHVIFMFTLAGTALQERLALKAVLNFLASFISLRDTQGTAIEKILNDNLSKIVEHLILGIAGRVPRSFSTPLVDVLFKLVGRYTEATGRCLHQLLSQEGFPSPLVGQKDKEQFARGILGTRSLKRFKEHAHNFSVKCRGLGNAAY